MRLKRARWETGKTEHKLAFGLTGVGGGGTISAEGGQYPLADYVRGGQNPLADYVRGDKICGGTTSAPTPVIDHLLWGI